MYSILIVEDKDIIRSGLLHIIEKLDLEFDTFLEAGNGQDALAIMQSASPDIVITDIRMPLMDGLDFIQAAKVNHPETAFIILSGYADFEYAQKAVSFGVQEYLLKPINKKKLRDILVKITQNIHKKLENKEKHNELIKSYSTEISRLQQTLLWKILSNRCPLDTIKQELANTGIVFKSSFFLIVSVKFRHPLENPAAENALNNIFSQLENACPPMLKLKADYGYLFLLFNPLSAPCIPLNKALEDINNTLSKIYGETNLLLQLGVSDYGDTETDLPMLLKQARTALDNRLFNFGPQCFYYKNHSQPELQASVLSDSLRNEIMESLFCGEPQAIQALKNYFKALLDIDDITSKQIIFETRILEKSIQAKRHLNHSSEFGQYEAIEHILSSATNYTEFAEAMTARLLSVHSAILSKGNPNAPVEQAIRYIERHYAKDISLGFISTLVSMNQSYFSTLFKRKTGTSFVHYLQAIRINKAKELLVMHGGKTYEIAEMVGFRDEKYFFKVFKNATGFTPNEYRNHYFKG